MLYPGGLACTSNTAKSRAVYHTWLPTHNMKPACHLVFWLRKSSRCGETVVSCMYCCRLTDVYLWMCRRLSCVCGPTSTPCASLKASWPKSCSSRWRTGAYGWSASRYALPQLFTCSATASQLIPGYCCTCFQMSLSQLISLSYISCCALYLRTSPSYKRRWTAGTHGPLAGEWKAEAVLLHCRAGASKGSTQCMSQQIEWPSCTPPSQCGQH